GHQAAHPDNRSSQGGGRPRPPARGDRDDHGEQAHLRRVLPLRDPPDGGHRAVAAHDHGGGLRRRRHHARRRHHRPGRRPAPRHRPGADRPRSRAPPRPQGGGLPHARCPREGVQEVRPQEGPQGAAVLQAL
ncbi:MAG: SSU ribosomal protein S9p (S16e), partial [uncultured Acidimicrobiales bacterium]